MMQPTTKRRTKSVGVLAALLAALVTMVGIGISFAANGLAANPTITVKPAKYTNETSATFRWTHPAPNTLFTCQLDSLPAVLCTSPAKYPVVGEGTHTFQVIAQARGLVSEPTSYDWTVDTTKPTAVVAPAGENPTDHQPVNFTVTFSEPVTVLHTNDV